MATSYFVIPHHPEGREGGREGGGREGGREDINSGRVAKQIATNTSTAVFDLPCGVKGIRAELVRGGINSCGDC